ncbi:hypothetical protein CHU98_g1546 [Xylaria longipes]|nr:hypothetical protein CHU98_g1546 [Xylaria longipes]
MENLIPEDRRNFLATATVWSTGVNEFLSPGDKTTVGEPVKWLDALENIQSSRDTPLTADEIDEAIQFRAEALPAGVGKLISILSADSFGPGFWDKDHIGPHWTLYKDVATNREHYTNQIMANNNEVISENFITHPYHIWPIQTTGGQWKIIFMVFETTPTHPTIYRRFSRYAIIDPRLEGGVADRRDADYDPEKYNVFYYIDQIITTFMSTNRLDGPDRWSEHQHAIWVPKQRDDDDWSSGLRVIQFVWEMIERIQDMETSGIRNIDALFRPMRPYFNPDYVRLSAAGAIAARGLERQDFRARICLARTREIKPKGRPQNAAELYSRDLAPNLALPPIQKIPQKFLDMATLMEEQYATWKYVTQRDLIDRENIPGLLHDSAERYKAQYEKEKEEKEIEEEEKRRKKAEARQARPLGALHTFF